MRQDEFEQIYQEQWQAFEQQLAVLSNKRAGETLDARAMASFPARYRHICHSLSIAKQRQYSPFLIERLNGLAVAGHQLIYVKNSQLLRRIVEFILHGFPREIQANIKLFWGMHALFYLPALVLFLLVLVSPELVYSLLPAEQVMGLEAMYSPERDVLGRERDSETDFMMFGHYIINNIGIAFRTFATGIFFGLGSLFFVIFNGLFFGAASGHIVNVHYTENFFTFVIAHGSVELTAIVISGMAGMKLGWSLIAPGNLTRFDALKLNARRTINLMYGAFFFLLLAAFIEAFWSSTASISPIIKYSVGGTLWVGTFTYLLWPRRRLINES